MATSGRAIVFSGTTVGIGLLALVVVPVPFIRSIGFGGMLIPLLSVLVCVTLLPVLLRRFGERLAWPRRRSEHEASRALDALGAVGGAPRRARRRRRACSSSARSRSPRWVCAPATRRSTRSPPAGPRATRWSRWSAPAAGRAR